jgi:hypothetical protein
MHKTVEARLRSRRPVPFKKIINMIPTSGPDVAVHLTLPTCDTDAAYDSTVFFFFQDNMHDCMVGFSFSSGDQLARLIDYFLVVDWWSVVFRCIQAEMVLEAKQRA